MPSKGLKYDKNKLEWNLLPLKLLEGVVKVLMFGKIKYNVDSWQNLNNAIERYYNALMRHVTKLDNGKQINHIDNESQLPTIDHIICNAIFLKYFSEYNNKTS